MVKQEPKHVCVKDIEIALIKQGNKYMQEKMESIEKILTDFINKAETTYATKTEVSQDREDIKELKNLLKWALGGIIFFVFGAIGTAIANLILK